MKKLCLLIGLVTLASGPLRAEQPAPVSLTAQITAIGQTYNLLHSQWFSPNLLTTEADKNTLMLDKFAWDNAIDNLMQQAEEQASSTLDAEILATVINRRIAMVQAMVTDSTNAYGFLMLCTVGPKQTTQALLATPLNACSLQQVLASVCHQLTVELMQALKQSIKVQPVRTPLATIINTALDQHHCPRTMHTRYDAQGYKYYVSINDAINVAWLDQCPLVASAYLELMNSMRQNTFGNQEAPLNATIIAQADSCIKLATAKRQELTLTKASTNRALELILDTVAAQLIAIKQAMVFTNLINHIATNKPELLPVFKQHCYLVQSLQIATLQAALKGAEKEAVDSYTSTIEQLFTQDAVSPSLLFALETCRTNLTQLKNDYYRGFAMRHTIGQHWLIPAIDTLLNNVEQAIEAVSPSAGGNGIVQYIMSGKWLAGSKLKSITKENGFFSLDFASDLLKKANVIDLKSAGIYALISASPFVLQQLIEYIRPRLDGTLNAQAEQLLHEQNKVKQQEKLMTFVTQNPAVFNELNKQHPELMDYLATAVKGLVKEA